MVGARSHQTFSESLGVTISTVKKKDGRTRWVKDLRELNKQTIKDSYLLTTMQEILHNLQGATVFLSQDAFGAYHAVRIEPGNRPCTAFISPFGTFQFIRMPFGLANTGIVYSRMLDSLLDIILGRHPDLQWRTVGQFRTFDTSCFGMRSSWNQDTTLQYQAVPVLGVVHGAPD